MVFGKHFQRKRDLLGFILYSFWKHSTMEDILESKFWNPLFLQKKAYFKKQVWLKIIENKK